MAAKAIFRAQNAEGTVDNLQVLFLYIDRFKNLTSTQLNFSGEGQYHLAEAEKGFTLSYRLNKKYPKSLFPIKMRSQQQAGLKHPIPDKWINNVTAIIGQNGAGKSNILDYLKRILTNNLYVNQDSLLILKVDGVVKVYHSFVAEIEVEEGLDVEILRTAETISDRERGSSNAEEANQRLEILTIPNLKDAKVVFYSPQADFQNFPFHFDDPLYNDISTNYLLEFDQGKGEEFAKSTFDKLLSHKSQTTRRFIDLIYSKLPLPEEIHNFIPKGTYIQINRLKSPEDSSRNLSPSDKAFINRFLEKVQENWSAAHKLRGDNDRKNYYRIQFRTELSYSIISHFFHNKEDEFGANSNMDVDHIDWKLTLEEIVRFYLANQKWRPSPIYVKLFNALILAIDMSDEFSDFGNESFSFRVGKDFDLVTLYSNYINYEDLFQDTGHPSGLLDFYWRGISSGEKSLLDLFSRLLHTKSKKFVNAGSTTNHGDEVFKTIFLLIDEGEIGFHPHWQKNYLKYLIDFLKYAYSDFNMQLILTSHSPFLISDLPRENIIFLEKIGEVSVVCDPRNLNLTFGGNIHEMLIDSFFLKDGIIGAFAQDKINDIIKEILSENVIEPDKMVELKYLIEAIGEPVVRIKLLKMLSEKKQRDIL